MLFIRVPPHDNVELNPIFCGRILSDFLCSQTNGLKLEVKQPTGVANAREPARGH